MRITRSCIDFVPPAETNETPAGDVFEVVEVGGEEEDGDDEDEDAGWVLDWGEEHRGGELMGIEGFVGVERTYKLLVKMEPRI